MNIPLIIVLSVITACSPTKIKSPSHPYTGEALGCGNFVVYKLTEDHKGYISVVFDASNVKLMSRHVYTIGKTDVIAVNRKRYDNKISSLLCNDVLDVVPKKILEETAEKGLVEIFISEEELKKAKRDQGYRRDQGYTITVTLRKIEFRGMKIDYLKIENIYVGWLPG